MDGAGPRRLAGLAPSLMRQLDGWNCGGSTPGMPHVGPDPSCVNLFVGLRNFGFRAITAGRPIHSIAPAPSLLCLVARELAPGRRRGDDSLRGAQLGARLAL